VLFILLLLVVATALTRLRRGRLVLAALLAVPRLEAGIRRTKVARAAAPAAPVALVAAAPASLVLLAAGRVYLAAAVLVARLALAWLPVA
jgi:hypothetical protein